MNIDDGIYAIIASYLNRNSLFIFLSSHEYFMELSQKSAFWFEMIRQRFPMYHIENFLGGNYNPKNLYLDLLNNNYIVEILIPKYIKLFGYLIKNKFIILNIYNFTATLNRIKKGSNIVLTNDEILYIMRILLENHLLSQDELKSLFSEIDLEDERLLQLLVNYRGFIDGVHVKLSKDDIYNEIPAE